MLLGGDPFRILRLDAAQAQLVGEWSSGATVTASDDPALARALVGANLAQPVPPPGPLPPTTVVVPVRDRPRGLRRLLRALQATDGITRTIVVDDASTAAGAIAAVADAHGADLIRRVRRGGAPAARNDGLGAVDTPVVAFVDSDCVPVGDWLRPLVAHLADPQVALAAPRTTALTDGPGVLATYEADRSPLDRGPHPAAVRPGGRVPFVPGAAMVARTVALGAGFDDQLRGGEDVDLVWRLTRAGWHVRYEPASRVAHDHRVTLLRWLTRRAYYGRTAAPLAQRHPGCGRPLRISPWSAAAWAAVAARRPAAAVVITALATCLLARQLRGLVDAPLPTAARLAGGGTLGAGRAMADAVVRHWWPVSLALAAVLPWARTPLCAAALVAPLWDARVAGVTRPLRWSLLRMIDDLAYGAGVWQSVLRWRTLDPLLPDLGWRMTVDDLASASVEGRSAGP